MRRIVWLAGLLLLLVSAGSLAEPPHPVAAQRPADEIAAPAGHAAVPGVVQPVITGTPPPATATRTPPPTATVVCPGGWSVVPSPNMSVAENELRHLAVVGPN